MAQIADRGNARSAPSRGPARGVDATSAPWRVVALAVAAVGWGANQFAPLLLVYERDASISTATADATFALYAAGLVPGLLIGGPASDRLGRRPVLLCGLLTSLLASVLLAAGDGGVALLFAGRLVAGIASGVAFSSGAAWIRELSGPHGPRRATVAMTAGFAGGPLVAGLLAQFVASPMVVPYLPHLALGLVALAALAVRTAPVARPARAATGGTSGAGDTRAAPRSRPAANALWRDRRFWLVVVPLAPWVFGTASIALAYLPAVVAPRVGSGALAFGAGIASVGALAGIAAQPIARRLGRVALIAAALGTACAALALAAVAAAADSPVLVAIAGVAIGGAYGLCQVAGLGEIQAIAARERMAAATAVYQCISYLGFGLPFLLAAVAVSPAVGLVALAGLAGLTAVGCTLAARRGERR